MKALLTGVLLIVAAGICFASTGERDNEKKDKRDFKYNYKEALIPKKYIIRCPVCDVKFKK